MSRKRAKKSRNLSKAPSISGTDPVVFELWTHAGGRCEFHGCNTYLLEDALTTQEVKLSNIAHIVARSKGGPRGDDPLPITERNKASNLMLLCTKCHAVIDKVDEYPKELLMRYKNEHEARIKYLTSLGVEHETVVLRIMGNIRGDSVSISNEEIRTAVLDTGRYPRYLGDERAIEIDLQSLPQEVNTDFWKMAIAKVNEIVNRQVVPAIESGHIGHISVFSLARIPILIHLGNALGDKIAADFYQHHRDNPAGWRWRKEESVQFESQCIQKGSNQKKIALLLSLSSKIVLDQLPEHINDEFTIYEITPLGKDPNRSLITARESLHTFQRKYQSILRSIEVEHGTKSELHLFAAIPAPVAIVCGRELLKDVSPQLHVYDRIREGYELALTIN